MGRATPGHGWFRTALAEAWSRPRDEGVPSSPQTPDGIDGLSVLVPATPALQDAIAAAKYGADGEAWRWLGCRLGEELRATATWLALDEDGSRAVSRPCLVPMPSPWLRKRHRGIDHTLVLARAVSKVVNGRVRPWLSRPWGPPQVGADRRARLRIAARIRPGWRWWATRLMAGRRRLDPNATIVLIDDVLTTGAGLSAAAEVLRGLGFRRVRAAVLIAQPPPEVGSGDVLSTSNSGNGGQP